MRFLLLAATGLLSCTVAHAQLGVRAGVLTAELSNNRGPYTPASSRSHLGYQVGVFYEAILDHHFSLVPELAFSHEYMLLRADNYIEYYGTNADVRLSYVTLPVPTRVSLGPVYAEVGPQFNLLLGGSERGTAFIPNDSGLIVGRSIDRPAAERYYRLDAGLLAGAGVQLRSGLGLGVRAYWGLRSLARPFPPGQGFNGELRNYTLQASVSYRLKRAS